MVFESKYHELLPIIFPSSSASQRLQFRLGISRTQESFTPQCPVRELAFQELWVQNISISKHRLLSTAEAKFCRWELGVSFFCPAVTSFFFPAFLLLPCLNWWDGDSVGNTGNLTLSPLLIRQWLMLGKSGWTELMPVPTPLDQELSIRSRAVT